MKLPWQHDIIYIDKQGRTVKHVRKYHYVKTLTETAGLLAEVRSRCANIVSCLNKTLQRIRRTKCP